MAYYYKINESKDILPPFKGFHLQKVKELKTFGPNINYDFTKHVLIELLDETTPEPKLWDEMHLSDSKNIVHKRMMIDPHRLRCRRAIVICASSDEAKQLAQRLSQTIVMSRCICAVVIEDLLSDLCLFEKQIIQFGDNRSQHKLLYVSDLNKSRGTSGLVQFLREKFSPFGTILSILVCSDNDDYAYPEGVIKFAYLSEAFAAELAFDQFVVGKERLSVTTHHNIVLSQCDLRIRLRDAQHNIENDDESDSYNSNYKVNNLDAVDDSVEKSTNYLHSSYINNSKHNTNDNYTLICNALDNTLPAFSQCNLYNDAPINNFDKTIPFIKQMDCDQKENHLNSTLLTHKNPWFISNANSTRSYNSNIKNSFVQQTDLLASETLLLEKNSTEIISCVENRQKCKSHSRKNIALESLLNVDKSPKNLSDASSFVTCRSLDQYSSALFLSPKKSSYKSFNSQQTNLVLENCSFSSSCKERLKPHEENLNDSEILKESHPKHSKKRKKKLIHSQKLCLKSQKTDLSQHKTLDPNTEVSEPSSPMQQSTDEKFKEIMQSNNLHLSIIKDEKSFQSSQSTDWFAYLPVKSNNKNEEPKKKVDTQNYENALASEFSKVADWLHHLPTPKTDLSEDADLLTNLQPTSGVGKLSSTKKVGSEPKNTFVKKTKQCNSRISVHKTPIVKSNLVVKSDFENRYSDNSSIENKDLNEMSLISSSDLNSSIPLTDEYKSPLQMWLKQELVSSVNNSAFESKEPSKSIIICVTKTGNNFISVGCSYMTCDTCYPESTDLLLGYT